MTPRSVPNTTVENLVSMLAGDMHK